MAAASGPRIAGLTVGADHMPLSIIPLLQLLPSLVRGLVDETLTGVIARGMQLIMLMYTRRRSEAFTDSSLAEVDTVRRRLLADIAQLVPNDARVNLNTPKVHKLQHFCADVKRRGHAKHSNSDVYESDHVHIKKDYRCVTPSDTVTVTARCALQKARPVASPT